MVQLDQYGWLFGVGLVVAFADGFGIGANDVANSFSTSVSSGSLTLLQACGIALFSEFLGAFLLGANTSDTIKNKIVKVDIFKKTPALLMLTMVCALLGSAIWTIVASKKGWPVSTTHSIVGGIIGAATAVFGIQTVDWKWTGFGKIAASWFISPVVAGATASLIYLSIKFLVLERENSFERGLQIIPLYFGLTAVINVFYIVYKGSPGLKLKNLPIGPVLGISFGVAAVVVVFCLFFYIPFLKRRIIGKEDLKWYHALSMPLVKTQPTLPEAAEVVEEGAKDVVEEGAKEFVDSAEDEKLSFLGRVKKTVLHSVTVDVVSPKSARVVAMHDRAKKYDKDTEILFSFLQVVTATLASFAHGSNDVANSVGPLSVIYDVFRKGTVSSKAPVPAWILAFGGIAIDIGLITYGWHVFQALGNQITYHSPSRGFSMELGTALTVVSASKLGVPVSTTQCITGATIGVGLCSGSLSSINWRKAAVIFSSWLVTVPTAASIAGLVMYFASHAPKIL
jgi:phosphate/sulfate permease